MTLTRPADIDWLYHGVGRFFPEAWEQFRSGVPSVERDGDLVAAYRRLLSDADSGTRAEAARRWCRWEDTVASGGSRPRADPRYADPDFRMAFARIVTHYFSHHAWLDDGALLGGAGRLADIPGVLVHGRYDLGGPPAVAWDLARAWPGAELHLVDGGHTGSGEMTRNLIAATDRFAGR